MLGRSAAIAEKDENDLPRHVERSQEDADQHEIVRNVRTRPVRGGVQNFFFRPAAGKKEWHTAERHHSYRISGKRDRHEPAQAAHFANVLFVIAAVNDRTGADQQKRLKKSICEKMHDFSADAADTKRKHHQTDFRKREIIKNDIE